MTDTRREEIAMAIGFASRHKFDASKDAAEFWEYISGEGREWYLRMADAVLPIVTPAPVAGWRGIPISTNERLPEKPGKRSYEHVRCLIFIHGKWEVGMWNCEHLVWDDDEGDDFRYHPTEPTHWMPLPPAPGTQPATEQPSVKEAARVLLDFMTDTDIPAQETLIVGTKAMHPNGWELSDRIRFDRGFAAALRSLAGDE